MGDKAAKKAAQAHHEDVPITDTAPHQQPQQPKDPDEIALELFGRMVTALERISAVAEILVSRDDIRFSGLGEKPRAEAHAIDDVISQEIRKSYEPQPPQT